MAQDQETKKRDFDSLMESLTEMGTQISEELILEGIVVESAEFYNGYDTFLNMMESGRKINLTCPEEKSDDFQRGWADALTIWELMGEMYYKQAA